MNHLPIQLLLMFMVLRCYHAVLCLQVLDLKPDNVLLDNFGAAAIADFGLVRVLDIGRDTLQGGIGTCDYICAAACLREQDLLRLHSHATCSCSTFNSEWLLV